MSLELLTVFVVAPLAVLVCYDIAKKNSRANVLMVIIATAELYGGRLSSHGRNRHISSPVTHGDGKLNFLLRPILQVS